MQFNFFHNGGKLRKLANVKDPNMILKSCEIANEMSCDNFKIGPLTEILAKQSAKSLQKLELYFSIISTTSTRKPHSILSTYMIDITFKQKISLA